METWYALNLGDAMLADEALGQVQTRFRAIYAEAGRPAGIALFVRHESDRQLHCDVKLYFSPMSEFIARNLRATPCRRPSPQGLSLLEGSNDAWALFFPNHERGR